MNAIVVPIPVELIESPVNFSQTKGYWLTSNLFCNFTESNNLFSSLLSQSSIIYLSGSC